MLIFVFSLGLAIIFVTSNWLLTSYNPPIIRQSPQNPNKPINIFLLSTIMSLLIKTYLSLYPKLSIIIKSSMFFISY
jgi:hypothetical protein